MIAGGSIAFEDTYDKPDTEHGSDTLRMARMAITTARMHYGTQADAALTGFTQPDEPADKSTVRQIYQHSLSSLVNVCLG